MLRLLLFCKHSPIILYWVCIILFFSMLEWLEDRISIFLERSLSKVENSSSSSSETLWMILSPWRAETLLIWYKFWRMILVGKFFIRSLKNVLHKIKLREGLKNVNIVNAGKFPKTRLCKMYLFISYHYPISLLEVFLARVTLLYKSLFCLSSAVHACVCNFLARACGVPAVFVRA